MAWFAALLRGRHSGLEVEWLADERRALRASRREALEETQNLRRLILGEQRRGER